MSILNSKIGKGFTTHTRSHPIKRSFRYNLSYLFVDLDEIDRLNQLPFFNWNKKRFFSLSDRTYLMPGSQSIKEKLSLFMKKNAPNIRFSKAYLLTSPGFFGINFNPVSFFYLKDSNHDVAAIIAEVHNTYNEKHLYLLSNPTEKKEWLSFDHTKEFHVSPFFTVMVAVSFLFGLP